MLARYVLPILGTTVITTRLFSPQILGKPDVYSPSGFKYSLIFFGSDFGAARLRIGIVDRCTPASGSK